MMPVAIAYLPGKQVQVCHGHLNRMIDFAALMGTHLCFTRVEADGDQLIECATCVNEAQA